MLVVCCDLRRPRIHEFFGLGNEVGFTSALLGKVPLADAIQAVPDQPGIDLLASGPLPPNPSELLSSNRTAEVLNTLRVEYDIVLVDSPPMLPVTDALVLSRRVDAVLLVSVAGATTRKEVVRATELLIQVEAPARRGGPERRGPRRLRRLRLPVLPLRGVAPLAGAHGATREARRRPASPGAAERNDGGEAPQGTPRGRPEPAQKE